MLRAWLGLAARRMYEIVRGIDRAAVVHKGHVKSMLAAKSFTATSSLKGVTQWLRVLVAELVERAYTA